MTLSYWSLKRTADLLTVPRWNHMSHANYWAGSSMFINPSTLSYSGKISSLYRWISWSIYGIWPDLNQLMLGLIWPCLMTLSYAPRYRNVRLCGGDKCGSFPPVYNLWYRTTWSQSICMRLRDYGWCSGRFHPHGKYGKLTVRIFS